MLENLLTFDGLTREQWIQLGGLFLGIGTLWFLVSATLLRRRRVDADEADGGMDDPDLEPVFQKPKAKLSELEKDVRAAGFYHPHAVSRYRTTRNVLVFAALVATGVSAILAPNHVVFSILIGGFAVAVLAFGLPRVYLRWRAQTRSRQVERGLPLAIDVLILCLSAGQNLLAALLQAAQQLKKTHPVLAQELTIAHQQAEIHSLGYALREWADRITLPEVRNLVTLLVQSEKLGADAATTLSELATNIRLTARQRAEAHANRLSFWMLFPSVLCFWVAAAIILIGPAYLEFFHYRQDSARKLRESFQTIQQIGQQPVIPPAEGGNVIGNPQ